MKFRSTLNIHVLYMYYIYIYIYIYSLLKFLQQNFKNTVQQNTPEALCESDVDPKKV